MDTKKPGTLAGLLLAVVASPIPKHAPRIARTGPLLEPPATDPVPEHGQHRAPPRATLAGALSFEQG